MGFFKRLIDFFTLGSPRPIRRLVAYYTVLAVVTLLLVSVFPPADQLFSGERTTTGADAPELLQDGMGGKEQLPPSRGHLAARLELVITTSLIMVAVVALMLPVSWVYMSARRTQEFDQALVQALIILPVVVAGVVLTVRNSLALAFSLAGVVAAVRFRTSLSDARDTAFVFLAIAVGFASGVQTLTVAAIVSVAFNFIVLMVWRYDFGRNVLEPKPASQWVESLGDLAKNGNRSMVPDRDLVLALTPKKLSALAERFDRVQQLVGPDGEHPRYNAVLSVRSNNLAETQQATERVLDEVTKRWKLDEVVTNEGKPSELYYLIRVRKSSTRDEILTAVREAAGAWIEAADVELAEGLIKEADSKQHKNHAHA